MKSLSATKSNSPLSIADGALNPELDKVEINGNNIVKETLDNMETEIDTTYDIYNVLVNHSGPLISESGIKTKEELLEINKKTNIKTFLIGESLLKNLEKNSIFSVL